MSPSPCVVIVFAFSYLTGAEFVAEATQARAQQSRPPLSSARGQNPERINPDAVHLALRWFLPLLTLANPKFVAGRRRVRSESIRACSPAYHSVRSIRDSSTAPCAQPAGTTAVAPPRSSKHRRRCRSMEASEEQALKDYADFKQKVKRTIYLDQLSPQVTNGVIKAALAQCANVVNVEFIVNYTVPFDIPSSALVEMEDEAQARAAVELMADFPFIIGGMPRPVRATHAKPEMFPHRPPRPGVKKDFRWVKQGDDGYEAMKKMVNLAKRQEAENLSLIKSQLEEEKELAKQQQEILDGNCKKYDLLENVMQNGAIKSLAHRYGVNLDD